MKLDFRSRSSAPAGIPGKIFASLFFLAFFAIGSVFAYQVGRAVYGMARTWTWRETPCRIVESRVDQNLDEARPFVFRVRYRYDVAGREYEGSTYRATYDGSKTHRAAQKLAERYREDSRAVCYVDPDDPGRSCLSRPRPWGALAILFPLVFVAVGAGGIYAMWRGGREGKATGLPRALSTSAVSAKKAAGCLAGFFAIFFLAGAGFLLFFAVPAYRVISARSWRAVPCTILASGIEEHSGDDGSTYSVSVRFEYEVGGETYRSNRYQFLGGSSGGRDSKEAVVAANRPGDQRTCYVNPKDPWDAVLNRSFTTEYLIALVPLLFVAVGLGGMYFVWRSARQKKSAAVAAFGAPGEFAFAPEEAAAPGPVVLKTTGPVAKFFGVTLVALFWNGIIAVFLWQAVREWRAGDRPWGLSCFLVPFVLVGLLLVWGVVAAFLALFNPRVRVTLSAGAIPLGESATLDWRFTGAASRITRVAIRVEGREEATYRRGTTTTTDRSVFAEIPVFEAAGGAGLVAGTATVTIPADSMHSFAASNNKVVWTLKLQGEIPNWPDVSQDYDLDVRPAKAGARS